MRTPILVCFLAAACTASFAQTPASSTMYPDPHVAGPEIYRPVLENESVRIYEVTFKPGARIAPHRHPDYVGYIVSGGTLRVTQPGAEPQVFQLKAGEVAYLPAQSHQAENIGNTEVKIALVELRKAGMTAPAGTEPHQAGPKISDHDGIPDEWEEQHGFKPDDRDGDADTNLEKYLHSLGLFPTGMRM